MNIKELNEALVTAKIKADKLEMERSTEFHKVIGNPTATEAETLAYFKLSSRCDKAIDRVNVLEEMMNELMPEDPEDCDEINS